MQIATDKSPKLTVSFRYLFAGIGMLIFISLIIVFKSEAFTTGYYGSDVLLPLTHLLTLGWITMTIMGAMFQLIPVITEKTLYSESLAKVIFYIYLTGTAWLIYAFAANASAYTGAGIISFAIILFLFDIAATMRGMQKKDLAVRYIVLALVCLFLTIIIGTIAAVGLHANIPYNPVTLLFLHITIAVIGWIGFIIIGFSFRLIPMFTLSHGYGDSYGRVSFVMFVSGLILLTAYFTLQLLIPAITDIQWIGIAGGIIILTGIISYILQMRIIYERRARKRIEPALWFSICATAYLLIAGIIGVWMLIFRHSFRIEIVYIAVGLLGFAGMYIVGMMHKIVPFLQWYNKYSSKIGLEKVPTTKDMVSEPLTWIQLFVFNAGLVALIAGVMLNINGVILASGVLLFAGSVMFLWNMLNVLWR